MTGFYARHTLFCKAPFGRWRLSPFRRRFTFAAPKGGEIGLSIYLPQRVYIRLGCPADSRESNPGCQIANQAFQPLHYVASGPHRHRPKVLNLFKCEFELKLTGKWRQNMT